MFDICADADKASLKVIRAELRILLKSLNFFEKNPINHHEDC